MNLLNWLRRDRVADTLAAHERRESFLAEAERLWPGTDSDEFDGSDFGAWEAAKDRGQVVYDRQRRGWVRYYCAPIACDLEDNYVCARHRSD